MRNEYIYIIERRKRIFFLVDATTIATCDLRSSQNKNSHMKQNKEQVEKKNEGKENGVRGRRARQRAIRVLSKIGDDIKFSETVNSRSARPRKLPHRAEETYDLVETSGSSYIGSESAVYSSNQRRVVTFALETFYVTFIAENGFIASRKEIRSWRWARGPPGSNMGFQ